MTVTVTADGLSISHKGSNGISTATVPDVCKTPTPAGPVPMPYPNISMSSSLADGTKTVTADGGNMIAINGSKYAMSSGDEPGTVGGVTSSTFKQESTWITYSFDVKCEGQPVCRLTDKKFQNHKNTVDMAGNVQSNVMGTVTLECDPTWTDCQKKQMKAKAAAMDAIAKEKGGLQTRPTAGALRDAADSWAGKYGRDWNKPDPNQHTRWPAASDPSKQSTQFYDDCAKTDDPKGAGMEADHVQEVQLGGSASGPFRWLDGDVNGASGRQIKSARQKGLTTATGFDTKNC